MSVRTVTTSKPVLRHHYRLPGNSTHPVAPTSTVPENRRSWSRPVPHSQPVSPRLVLSGCIPRGGLSGSVASDRRAAWGTTRLVRSARVDTPTTHPDDWDRRSQGVHTRSRRSVGPSRLTCPVSPQFSHAVKKRGPATAPHSPARHSAVVIHESLASSGSDVSGSPGSREVIQILVRSASVVTARVRLQPD